jgi:hypothetical protein
MDHPDSDRSINKALYSNTAMESSGSGPPAEVVRDVGYPVGMAGSCGSARVVAKQAGRPVLTPDRVRCPGGCIDPDGLSYLPLFSVCIHRRLGFDQVDKGLDHFQGRSCVALVSFSGGRPSLGHSQRLNHRHRSYKRRQSAAGHFQETILRCPTPRCPRTSRRRHSSRHSVRPPARIRCARYCGILCP